MENWKDKYENKLKEINKQTDNENKEIIKRKNLTKLLRNNSNISLFLKDIEKSISLINKVNSNRTNSFNINIDFQENIFGNKSIHLDIYIYEFKPNIILQSENDYKKRIFTINLDNPQKPFIAMCNCRTKDESTGNKKVYKNEWVHTEDGFEQDYEYESTGSQKVIGIKKIIKMHININDLNTELSNSIIGWLLFENNVISTNGKTIEANINNDIFINNAVDSIGILLGVSFIASFITPLFIGIFTGTIHYWNYYIFSFIAINIIGHSLNTYVIKEDFD